jgi:hypothetical protein
MAGTEEWFRPNKRILKRGSEGGRHGARGALRPVAYAPKPRANVLSPGGAKERLGAAQSDDNLRLSPAGVVSAQRHRP